MKIKMKYQLNLPERAFEPILKKLNVAWPQEIDWVDFEPENDDEEGRVRIFYPNEKYPELTRELFMKILCTCYQKAWGSMFNIEAILCNEEGAEAVSIGDTFSDYVKEDRPRFKYKGELFAEDLQRKIDEIKQIIYK